MSWLYDIYVSHPVKPVEVTETIIATLLEGSGIVHYNSKMKNYLRESDKDRAILLIIHWALEFTLFCAQNSSTAHYQVVSKLLFMLIKLL